MTMFNLNPTFVNRALQTHQAAIDRALERLSTGKQINRASDDPSGMMAADSIMFDIRKIEKQLEAGEMAQYFAGAADGSLSVIADKLIELRGLVVSAANSGAMSKSEREALQIEADSILSGISHVSNTTTFRGERILANGFAFSIGGAGLSMAGISLSTLGSGSRAATPEGIASNSGGETLSIANITAGGALNLVTGNLELASKAVDSAISEIAMRRGAMGASLNGITAEMNVRQTELEELTGAHSDLMDLDYAKETSELVRAQIMREAAVSAIVIGRENAERSLELLMDSTKIVTKSAPIKVPSVES